MRLVEQHVIARADRRFAAIDRAAFASKNLYNKALYATRQAFFAVRASSQARRREPACRPVQP